MALAGTDFLAAGNVYELERSGRLESVDRAMMVTVIA